MTAERNRSSSRASSTIVEEVDAWRGLSKGIWLLLWVCLIVIDVNLILRSMGSSGIGACGESCDSVIGSQYGKILGIPLGYLALASHVGLLSLLFWRGTSSSRLATFLISGAIWGAAICLIFVQASILHKWCGWCNTAHGLGMVLSAWVLWKLSPRSKEWLSVSGAAVVAGLTLSFAFAGSKSEAPRLLTKNVAALVDAEPEGRILVHGGRFTIQAQDFPTKGTLHTGRVILALTDFTCPHCLRVHAALEDLLEESPNQFAVIWLPAYRNELGGKIQGYMQALFQVDPEAYDRLTKDLWAGDIPLNEESVKAAVAQELGGNLSKLQEHLSETEKQLALTREIVLANKAIVNTTDLPQLLIADRVIVGDGGETGALAKMLRGELDLEQLAESVLALDQTEFDVGTVVTGEAKEIMVRFRNVGKTSLRIEGFQELASGRVALGQQGKWSPEQSGEVRVIVPVPKQDGPFELKMQLLSNAPKQPFTVRGVANTLWSLSSPSFDFGVWASSSPVPEPKTVRVSFKNPCSIGVPMIGSSAFTGRASVVQAQREFDVTVIPPPDLAPGDHKLTVLVQVRPGVDLATGNDLPLAPGMPSSIQIPLSIQRL